MVRFFGVLWGFVVFCGGFVEGVLRFFLVTTIVKSDLDFG